MVEVLRTITSNSHNVIFEVAIWSHGGYPWAYFYKHFWFAHEKTNKQTKNDMDGNTETLKTKIHRKIEVVGVSV